MRRRRLWPNLARPYRRPAYPKSTLTLVRQLQPQEEYRHQQQCQQFQQLLSWRGLPES